MMLIRVVQGELEEVVEVVDIVGDKEDFNSLARSSHVKVTNINAKAWALLSCSLLKIT